MKRLPGLLLSFICVLTLRLDALAQNQSLSVDKGLQEQILSNLKDDFLVVADDLQTDKEGNVYWILSLLARESSQYFIHYSFSTQSKDIEHEYYISIEDTNRPRLINYDPSYNYLKFRKGQICHYWKNDTIKIPFQVYPKSKKHSLKLTKKQSGSWNSFDKEGYHDHTKNLNYSKFELKQTIPELAFFGAEKRWSTMHRAARKGTPGLAVISLLMKAEKPGKFTLNLGDLRKIPVIIFEEQVPTMALHEQVYYSELETKGKDSGDSSMGNRRFEPVTLQLRVGDYVLIKYMAYDENYEEEVSISNELKFFKSEFSIPEQGYDYWLFGN